MSSTTGQLILRALCLALLCLALARFGILPELGQVDAFIFWKAHSTACEEEICDGIDTNSGRNVACCFLFSKCCGYKNLDEAEAIRANLTGSTPSP